MKKTYMKPAMEQVMIETTSLIAASPLTTSDEGKTFTGTLTEEEATSDVTVLSKDNDFELWDE